MIAAALAGGEVEAAARESLRRAGAAEMDESGEILQLPSGRLRARLLRQDGGDAAVEIDGGQLDGVARQQAAVEAGEPTVVGDGVIPDAGAARLDECRVGHLVHADRARGRRIDGEG